MISKILKFFYINIGSWHIWKIAIMNPPWKNDCLMPDWFGIFRNRPGVIKWIPGKILPLRWGFYILGFEFGDRGSHGRHDFLNKNSFRDFIYFLQKKLNINTCQVWE